MYRILPRILQPEFPATGDRVGLLRANVPDSAILRQGGRSSSSVSNAGCLSVIDDLRQLRRGRSGRNQGVAVGGLPAIQYVLHQGRVR